MKHRAHRVWWHAHVELNRGDCEQLTDDGLADATVTTVKVTDGVPTLSRAVPSRAWTPRTCLGRVTGSVAGFNQFLFQDEGSAARRGLAGWR